MHRIVIALLSALDALITAAVGVAFVLAPLALFWATTPGTAWGDLWDTSASIWQLGHLVPLHIALPDTLLMQTGVASDAATFIISLAPLAFVAFAAISAARSGVRAARSGSWITGVLSGGVIFAAIAALIQLSSHNSIATTVMWQALLFPALVYFVPLLIGGLVAAWIDGDDGLVDMIHDRVDALDETWSELPALAGRGIALVCAGLIAVGALGVLVTLIFRGGEVIALFQSNRVDLWGAILLTLVHLSYLPTLIIWAVSFIAGPGFSVGTGASVSPAATEVGAVPTLPLFGLLPEHSSPWLFSLVLVPLLLGAVAGWVLRSRYAAVVGAHEPLLPRVVLTVVVAGVTAGLAAAASVIATGGIGPGRLAHLGPHPGWVALAVGAEVLVGAAILLLPPRRAEDVEFAQFSDLSE